MKRNLFRSILAAIVVLSVASHARATAPQQFYNVDYQTLPNGPIQLQNGAEAPLGGGYWLLSGDAVNTSATTTYDNVDFLNEWAFDNGTAFTYNGVSVGVSTWTSNAPSSDGNILQVVPVGWILASQVSPVPYAWNSLVFPSDPPAFVLPSDLLPYVSIGTLAPGASVPFSETVYTTASEFDFVSSFISTTPVPEPSTFVLLGIGAIGAAAVVIGKRRRTVAA